MEVFNHHIYEYKKGVRKMILHTFPISKKSVAIEKLERSNIAYFIQPLGDTKINIFFGEPNAIAVISKIVDTSLNKLSLEHDFIIGALLGYDLKFQCERFLERTHKQKRTEVVIASS